MYMKEKKNPMGRLFKISFTAALDYNMRQPTRSCPPFNTFLVFFFFLHYYYYYSGVQFLLTIAPTFFFLIKTIAPT